MNTQEFLQLHTIPGGINNAYSLNINCITGSNYETDKTVTITEFTITEDTLANFDPNSENYPEQVNLVTILQQIEKLTLVAPISGSTSIKVNLDIVSKARYRGEQPNKNYYYFAVKPVEIPYSPAAIHLIDKFTLGAYSSQYPATLVNLVPYITVKNYIYSDYYPLINNTQESRTSYLIQKADRDSSNINPTNLEELLEQTAEPAPVQDSNYTSTGWINARYKGTNTAAKTYNGVSPVVVGVTYRGEVNSNAVPDATIFTKELAQRNVGDLLYTGVTQQPKIPAYRQSKYIVAVNIGINDTRIEVTVENSLLLEIIEGTILRFIGTSTTEYMRVVAKVEESTKIFLEVERAYLGSVKGSYAVDGGEYGAGAGIWAIPADYSYRFTGTTSNIVRNSDSKIWVEATEQIIYTDKYGIIYSGSIG